MMRPSCAEVGDVYLFPAQGLDKDGLYLWARNSCGWAMDLELAGRATRWSSYAGGKPET